jgi:hypothetical protein
MTGTIISTNGVDVSYADQLPPWLTFDQFGRYSMLREALEAARTTLGETRFRVLDVGGWTKTLFWEDALPILSFLPTDDVLVLDQAESDLPHYQRGDGTRLDFPDNAFDFVTTADTLEHIPADRRAAFVGELVRVARRGVVLVAPFKQPVVEAAEDLLFRYIEVELGRVQQQLAEHRGYGLPVLSATEALFHEQGTTSHTYPSGYIHSWLLMMMAKHYLFGLTDDPEIHMRVDQYYIRWLATAERREPSYRHCIVAAKDNTGDWLAAVHRALAATITPSTDTAADDWRQSTNWLIDLLTLKGKHLASTAPAAPSTLEGTVAAQQQQITDLTRMVEQRDAAINDLQQRAAWQQERIAALQTQLDRVANGALLRVVNRLKRRG